MSEVPGPDAVGRDERPQVRPLDPEGGARRPVQLVAVATVLTEDPGALVLPALGIGNCLLGTRKQGRGGARLRRTLAQVLPTRRQSDRDGPVPVGLGDGLPLLVVVLGNEREVVSLHRGRQTWTLVPELLPSWGHRRVIGVVTD